MEMIEEFIKKNVPNFAAFLGLAVVCGASVSIFELDRAYVFPIGYIAGLLHSKVEKLVRNKLNNQ